MTDPRHCQPETPAADELEYCGYAICLQQTALEWMAVITRAGERPSIVLASDREVVLDKARQWIETSAGSDREGK